MAGGVGAKISLDGFESFAQKMKAAAAAARTLKSELASTMSQFSSTDRSVESLTKKNEVLAKSIDHAKATTSAAKDELDKQRAVLDKLQQELDEATNSQNKNVNVVAAAQKAYNNQAIAVEKLEKQYYDAQTDVNKMSRELEENEKTIKDIKRGYNDAGQEVDEFGNTVERAGDKGSIGLGKIVTALGLVKIASAAFNMLKNSINDAVSRVDTLNRFPRILEMMGYSADQAKAATNRLSDGIAGLPTKLDDIVASVQGFTLITNDLDLATDTALSLNNAFLAGGATAEDAARGLRQYNQMLANGIVDATSWRTITETMGPALNQVADAFGYAGATVGSDFYNALKSGSITFDELNAKIIELNGSVGGFEEQAKAASGGIATSWGYVKNAVTRGAADMITSLDEGLSEFGGIEGIIMGLKDVIVNMFKSINTFLPKAIKFIADLYSKIQPFLPIITGIVAALVAYHATVEIAKTATLAWETAQKLLNGTMALNPIGIVVALIAALVTAIIHLWNTNEGFREGVISVWTAIKDFVGGVVDAIKTFFTETLPNAFQNAVDWLTGLPGRIWDAIVGAVENIIQWGRDMAQKALDAANNVFTNIVETIKGIPARMLEIGKNIVEGIWNGIKNAANWLWTKLKEWVNDVLDFIKNLLGINSPSKIFRDQIGKNMALGIGEGFEDAMPGVEKDMQHALDGITDTLTTTIPLANAAIDSSYAALPTSGAVNTNTITNTLSPVVQITINAEASPSDEAAWQEVSQALADAVSEKIYNLEQSKLRAWGGK